MCSTARRSVKLVALFSPEHGIRGTLDDKVASSTDEKTGLPIHSLYGETRRPTAAMLDDLDVLVVDLQDIGARFYTYTTTLAYVLEEAAKRSLPVVVLDRPNPINGFQIEGPALDKAQLGFTGYYAPMPIRHGMTVGELARLFNGENKIGADLTVVAAKNWQRDAWFDETALPWVNPSPNMRNLIQATVYPGIGAIETTNLSVGRGTDTPFEQVGAPWIDGARARRRAERTAYSGHQVLSGAVHADVQQVRRPGMPGRVPHRHGSGVVASGAARSRDRRDAPQDVRSGVRARCRGTALRLARGDCAHSRRGRSGGDCRLVERRGSALAPLASALPVVPLSFAAYVLSCQPRQICRIVAQPNPLNH